MTGREMFTLFLVFITGLFAGAYLYVTSFAPSYNDDGVVDVAQVDFLLQGKKVGGCSQGGSICPSFELRGDRTYTYIPQYRFQDGDSESIQGKLGKDSFEVLRAYVANVNLSALEEKTPNADCSPIYDTNYQYNLVYNGETYTYDTCNTVFKESVLATKFYPLWTRLATTIPVAPLLEEGLTGFLRDKLDEKFQYDD